MFEEKIHIAEILLVLASGFILCSSLASTSIQRSEEELGRNTDNSYDLLIPKVVKQDLNIKNGSSALENEILFRKCCQKSQFYDLISHECQPAIEDIFELYIHNAFPELKDNPIETFSKRLTECPNGHTKPISANVSEENSIILLQSGLLYDGLTDNLYNSSSFCLELVGEDVYSSILTTALCEREEVPYHTTTEEHLMYANKCCPDNHFLNIGDLSCSLLPNNTNVSIQISDLQYSNDFHCVHHAPMEINIQETYFSKDHLCLLENANCYSSLDYCIDYISPEGNSKAAFVCPDDVFINKCCPENQNLNEEGCSPTNHQSLTLSNFLMSNRYKIKNLALDIADCNPVLLEDDTKSNISWYYDPVQHNAVIMDKNNIFKTKNYCIDDFSNDGSVFVILKVCSHEVGIHHAVKSVEKFPNALGKCCPVNMAYQEIENTTKCENKNETGTSAILDHFGSHHLLYAGIPTCNGNETYFKYFLNNSTKEDYGEITNNGFLSVVQIENGCKIKETLVKKDSFCVENLFNEGKYELAVYVCVPKGYSRGFVNVILVGLSCAALITTFFVLMFTRVRRGMVTMRKVNTLAGKILLSYVISILIGYLALGVGVLADPKEEIGKCYIIVGFILFFSIAGFCWNTSICVEGLLLTLNVRMDEKLRYILHSLWAWGTSGLITTIALVMDANSEQLDCDSITPRIGREMCFFSDPMAAFLYFYLPISLTVVLNAIMLISAKLLRKSQLRNLGIDHSSVPKPKHESIKKVLSVKNIRNKLKNEPLNSTKNSGLRIHQTKITWLDTLKLVLWSGTTWLTEILGTVYATYRLKTEPDWYGYIFYIPVAFNTLRGVGISIIILISPDNKTKMIRFYRTWTSRLSSFRNTQNLKRNQTTCRKGPSVSSESQDSRRFSVSSMVTNISDMNVTDTPDNIDESNRPVGVMFRHSVSQVTYQKDEDTDNLHNYSENGDAITTDNV